MGFQNQPIQSTYKNPKTWTPIATTALLSAGANLVPEGRPVAKNQKDHWGRSEYLTMDVMVLPSGWGPPMLVAEHENSPHAERIQYNAWKLLAVDAPIRILVAYFGIRGETKTRSMLESVVAGVCSEQPHKNLVLLSGDYWASPSAPADLATIFSARHFGPET